MNIGKANICRLCLTNENGIILFDIFDYTVTDLVQKIEMYMSMQVSEDDELPTTACINCIDKIKQFDAFKEMCHNSYNFLCQKLSENVNTYSNKVRNKLTTYGNERKAISDVDENCTKEDSISDADEDCDYACSEDNPPIYQTLESTGEGKRPSKKSVEHVSVYAEEDCDTLGRESKVRIYKIDDIIREIIGENIYICDICGTHFDSFIEYFEHQDTHNGEPVFKCCRCREVFYERRRLVEHDYRHKVPCEVCKLEVLPKSMAAHLLIHTDIHKCPYCGMRHTSNASLDKHIKARHIGVKGFVCHICGKQSSCQSSMNRHMAYHSNDRPYKCKYCDFCAKSLNIVQVHTSRKHFAERCVCEVCAKIFKSQPSLVQHTKRIHTARKHVCDICGKAFIERYNLTRHLKKHSGQRLHECKVCHKEFFTVRKLKEHMHSHRQGCVNCPKCGKEFFYKKYFNKHVVRCTENYANKTYYDSVVEKSR